MKVFATFVITAACFAAIVVPRQQASAQGAQPATRQARENREPAPVPVPLKEGKAALTPRNSTIQFVGLHAGEEPNPRIGHFTKFTGELTFDDATRILKQAVLNIETASLTTPIDRLTGHLRSPDFFDVRQYPESTFESTRIEVTDAAKGEYKITGDLTIREVKNAISFPATLTISDAGALLQSEFNIKRSDFGMTFGVDRVVDEVALTVTVGKPTPGVRPQRRP